MSRPAPFVVAHLTTADISLELLLRRQLDAVMDAGGSVIGISSPGPWVVGLEATGVRHVALGASTRGWSLLDDVRAMRQLWRALRTERPTVLHTHNPKTGAYGRILGRLAGVPIVVNTVHGLYATDDDRWARRLAVYAVEAVASRFSDAELVQSREDLATMVRWHLASPAKLGELGNGVDLGRFTPSAVAPRRRAEIRAEWGIDDDTVVVGAVGRLVAEKGYGELLIATRGLPGATVVIVGGEDPEKADALSPALIEEARLDGVVFAGHRDDMPDVYRALDLFVLASHREGFPRAAMEAAAMGLPVVATDIRGCRQVVDHEVNGLLVPAGDVADLRGAIARLVAEPETRARLGRAGRMVAQARFDDRDVIERVLRCYRDVADRKGVSFVPLDQEDVVVLAAHG